MRILMALLMTVMAIGSARIAMAQAPCSSLEECWEMMRDAETHEAALPHINQIIETWTPQDEKHYMIDALVARGQEHYRSEDIAGLTAGLADFRRAITVAPDRPDGYYGTANLHMLMLNIYEQGTPDFKTHADSALAYFQTTIKIEPNHVDARWNMGRMLQREGLVDEAIEAFTGLVDILPRRSYDKETDTFSMRIGVTGIPSKAKAEFYGARGELYLKKDMHQEAFDDFTQAVNEYGSYARGHFFRAYIQFYYGDNYEAAYNSAARVIEIDPDYTAQVYYFQGYYLFNTKKIPQAIAAFTQAVNRNPKDRESFFYRGHCYWQQGKSDLTIKDFKKAADLGHKEARTTLRNTFRVNY